MPETHSDKYPRTTFRYPEQVTHRFTDVDGFRTHHLEAGDPSAPPLVLVHGGALGIGLGADRWFPTILPLADRFHVLAVDELGAGETDPPPDGQYTVPKVRAEHVLSWLEQLDLGPVHLVGQSTGGWIATYIALLRPDLIDRLVLIDSGSVAGAGYSEKGDDHHLPFFDKVFKPGTMAPKLDLSTREGILEFQLAYHFDDSAFIDAYVERLLELSDKWLAGYRAFDEGNWQQEDVWRKKYEGFCIDGVHTSDLVADIDIETLVLWAKDSNKGFDKGVELYKKFPNAQLHVFDRANHFLWLDRPDDFVGLVSWFCSKGR